ncbi:AGAP012431-PA [Anopheles gambiae str. PEST]|uniref:AGAP001088-PA n=2 Tax=gambiae species complex TaxID=44542 RepID=A0NDY3_ANOGA|nr:uncharacterized protein LOC120956058 [Anopheles coluzzii]EAU76188.1 AGAP001088-PA [Anopheles gambiae str. PEST]EAU76778.1 AGAP012431-PA [Anopheles gambiae str. PEST]
MICGRCLRLYVALYMIRQFSSILERGLTRNHLRTSSGSCTATSRALPAQHAEAQPAPGAPIAPPDGVEEKTLKRSGQEFNPSDPHYPLPHNSCSSNRTEPTALLIAVKFPGRRKNPTSVSISSTVARWQHRQTLITVATVANC